MSDSKLPDQVETAIEFASRDVTRAIVDSTGSHPKYAGILRNVAGMLHGVAYGAIVAARDSAWTSTGEGCWWLTRQAEAGHGGLDKGALTTAVNEWWNGLDDAGKYRAIIGNKPQRSEQFVNEKIQHFQNKNESELSKEDPELLEAYRKAKPAPAAPVAPAPSAPAAPAAPTAPAPTAPAPAAKHEEETPGLRSIFDGNK